MERSRVSVLGPATVLSPLKLVSRAAFVSDESCVLRTIECPGPPDAERGAFERAGPRANLFFNPAKTTVGILSAGGICPGINDVIRSLVLELHYAYGVSRILGFRYGFAGLNGPEPMVLGPSTVRDIHMHGGTVLGTSRGPQEVSAMVDTLVRFGVDTLLVIGGDGTMRAAHGVHEELASRGLSIGVVGIPKTIDNDIPFVDKTFGFDTAVAMARHAIEAAHAEARSVANGVGLVKLMGRDAGFIAANATLASQDVNVCLVPEVPFSLRGESGLLTWLERRLAERSHAVIVVAEGCAVSIPNAPQSFDASGNAQFTTLGQDVGRTLRAIIEEHFQQMRLPLSLKYIDPSYMVRATRPSAEDAIFCDALARNAVHAAMAGKTDILIGRWHRYFTHMPLRSVLAQKKRIEPAGDLWRQVVESTGQPSFV